MLYTEPRYTKDLAIWIDRSAGNAGRVYRALAEFGAPLAGIEAEEFSMPDIVYQLGVPPSRIDVLTSITGVDFAEAWPRRRTADFDDVAAAFIDVEDLMINKRAAGRDTELIDCRLLEEARRDTN